MGIATNSAERDDGLRGDLELGSIPGLVAKAAERFGDRDAVIDGDVTITYRALAAEVNRAARGLLGLGVAPGDRVAIWGPNTWEWIVAALATHAVGGVLVPVNTRFKGEEAAFVLSRSRARVLLTVNGFLGTDYVALLRSAEIALPDLTEIALMRGEATARVRSWNAFLEAGSTVSDAALGDRARVAKASSLADIIFTSGTTGHPKGVTCTHGQSLRAFRDWSDLAGLRAGDRYLVVNPFFHTFGYKAGFLACFMMGATVLPHAVFDAGAILERVARERISVLPGPPALYQAMLARPDLAAHDLRCLRLAVTGAASIPVELVHRMKRELGFDTVLTAYGLTEDTGIATMCRRGDDAETIASTSGRAMPGLEVTILDDAGQRVATGVAGEIAIRGYAVTNGYFEDPAATSAAIDANGTLRTGDVGVLDAQGNLRITDRKKDMFIVGGFNAYPAEIERVLLRHDAISQAAVVGAPDDRLGEVAVAYVVTRPGALLAPAELVSWSRDRMANYKVPRRVEIVDTLPMNASGKVKKHELRERARSAAAPGRTSPAT